MQIPRCNTCADDARIARQLTRNGINCRVLSVCEKGIAVAIVTTVKPGPAEFGGATDTKQDAP